MNHSLEHIIMELKKIVFETFPLILEHYHSGGEVTWKEDHSPLTNADRASHMHIQKKLSALTPDIPIISEEGVIPEYSERKNWQQFWLVDPLDGTREFLKKNDEFTVNVALIRHGVSVCGIVGVPVKDEIYYACENGGAFKQKRDEVPTQIYSRIRTGEEPRVIVASRSDQNESVQKMLAPIQIESFVSVGSSLKLCILAEGKADVYIRNIPLKEWDVAAGDCLFRNSHPDVQKKRTTPFVYNTESMLIQNFRLGEQQ